jgi:hypothetical protein
MSEINYFNFFSMHDDVTADAKISVDMTYAN